MADSSTFIYPILILMALFVVFTLVINPFTADGTIIAEVNNNNLVDILYYMTVYGLPMNETIILKNTTLGFVAVQTIEMPWNILENVIFGTNRSTIETDSYTTKDVNIFWKLLPKSVKDYLGNSVQTLYYLPDWLQIPLVVIIYLSLMFALYVVILGVKSGASLISKLL